MPDDVRELKIWIAVREDLYVPPGKLAAQVGHAAMGAFWDTASTRVRAEYMSRSQVKIVVGVEDEAALVQLAEACRTLPSALITDEGRTVFGGEHTTICLGVGPCFKDELPEALRTAKLYRATPLVRVDRGGASSTRARSARGSTR